MQQNIDSNSYNSFEGDPLNQTLTWIHGDEDATGPLEFDLAPLEDEALRPGGQGGQDRQDLLGHDGQYLDVDTVKLVKTSPRAGLGQTWIQPTITLYLVLETALQSCQNFFSILFVYIHYSELKDVKEYWVVQNIF